LIGSGKDGLPIILGNVDTPLPPAGGVPPTDNDTMNKERTTSASSTVPLEKTPAAALATPPEGREDLTAGRDVVGVHTHRLAKRRNASSAG